MEGEIKLIPKSSLVVPSTGIFRSSKYRPNLFYILVSSAFVSSGWKYAAPAGVGAFIVVLFVLLLIICCRTKHDTTSKTTTTKKTFVAEERYLVLIS